MMRIFGNKQKNLKQSKDAPGPVEDRHFSTPIHAQHAVYTQHPTVNIPPLYPDSSLRDHIRQSSADDQQWEVVSTHDDLAHSRALAPSRASSLPPGASPPLQSPPIQRSPSPYSLIHSPPTKPASKDREPPQSANTRKKQPHNAPVALGILRSLDPARQSEQQSQTHVEEMSESGHGDQERGLGEKKERKAFWVSGKEKHKEKILGKDRGKEKDSRDDNELTRMIGFLTATASEDWMLVLEVCDRASANENNAKEAVRALRREFKYGEPPAQLSAARLWAIMSRNCSEVFVLETAGRKFLYTLEDLITSPRTSPVVRERLLDVIAASAYNSPKDSGIRSLWKKVKPTDKPDEGVPFDLDDSMINPPANLGHSQNGIPIQHSTQSTDKRSTTKDRIIPLEEDMRRLFQECHIGTGNAALLSDALVACKPERLKTDAVIKEFYAKCRSSQELIFAQIPWATAGAERSRAARSQLPEAGQRLPAGELDGHENGQTTEEKLLEELLKANEDLLFVLKQYEDLERVAVERRTEDISRKVTRMNPQHNDPDMWYSSDYSQSLAETASSRSPSPSLRSDTPPRHAQSQPFYHSRSQSSLDNQSQLLAPPPAAPHGPRSPQALLISRAPSSGLPSNDQQPHVESPFLMAESQVQKAVANIHLGDYSSAIGNIGDNNQKIDHTPMKPSAKALGKRRLVESVISNNFDPELYQVDQNSSNNDDNQIDSDQDDDERDSWLHPPVNYVYDAAAERTQQRLLEATAALMVNGVH